MFHKIAVFLVKINFSELFSLKSCQKRPKCTSKNYFY
nr:MAG TPA: hypothetical protein [Caudoviricetes sp.]